MCCTNYVVHDCWLQLAAAMLAKIPELFDIEAATAAYPITYEDSMNTVLVQELQRYNNLVATVVGSLKDIRCVCCKLGCVCMHCAHTHHLCCLWNPSALPSAA